MNRTLASLLAVIATLAIVVIAGASVYSAKQASDSAKRLQTVETELRKVRKGIDRICPPNDGFVFGGGGKLCP